MNRIAGSVNIAAIISILILSVPDGFASENRYIEDFSTTFYKDAANTTAWWDKVDRELKLFPFAAEIVGSFDTPGNALGAVVDGDFAYIADNTSGLQVIDISDPGNPELMGTCDTPGVAYAVAISGDHAFVADYGSGLQVIDIGNPAHPVIVGSFDTPGDARNVFVAGDHAFVADYGSGLQVIDISDPVKPVLAGACDTPGSADGVFVSGDHAFVADYTYGLQVIDISDPANPAIVGTCNTSGGSRNVTISGDYAFVADYNSGLQVIDISDPTGPALAGNCDTPGLALDVVVSGDCAYVADGSSGFHVIDIDDPTMPTLGLTCDTPGSAYGVAVSGDHAFVADYGGGLQVIDICDPVNPRRIGRLAGYTNYGYDIVVSGDYVFVADGTNDLMVFNISDPANPAFVFPIYTPGVAQDVAISGDCAFVADGPGGLRMIDISDPTSPVHLGTQSTSAYAYGVAISGDYAYVAASTSGLLAIDVGNPASPVLAGTFNTPGSAYDVAVSGNYAYVADYGSGLQVIDISDPANPAILGTCNTSGIVQGLAVSGDYVYAADSGSGLQVIDISDPSSPVIAGTCDTPGYALNVALSGDYAFVADDDYGVHMIDINDPTLPVINSSFYDYSISSVAISGEYVVLANYGLGLQMVQVFQSELDLGRNIGKSNTLDASSDNIIRARLSTTQTNTVSWKLSADSGANWQDVTPNGAWNLFAVPGNDLVWRSTHAWADPVAGPTVTRIEIDWLTEEPFIDSIADVPEDQGGWVLVNFTRSGRDFLDEATLPIEEYGVWQRIDDPMMIESLNAASPALPEKNAVGDKAMISSIPAVTLNGRTFVRERPDLAASSFPPGTWERVDTVPAVQQDEYVASVPTVADSSGSGINHTVLVVTAHTANPMIWYVSEPDSGWSVDNIAPAAPVGFAVAYNTGSGNHLAWDPSGEEDFHYFRVYRSNDPDFVPTPSDLVHSTTDTGWSDPDYDGWNVYYKITALDYVENESEPASPGTVTEADGPEVPGAFALYPNVPNPFNPSTTIRYDVPSEGGVVTFRIYNVSGRLVRTLVEGPQTAGQKTVIWDGKDDSGRSAASGVYFSRLQAPGYNKTLKMVLLK